MSEPTKPEVLVPSETAPSYQLEIEDLVLGEGEEAVAGRILADAADEFAVEVLRGGGLKVGGEGKFGGHASLSCGRSGMNHPMTARETSRRSSSGQIDQPIMTSRITA